MSAIASKALEDFKLLPGKTAVIIGATTGIGASIARLYANIGCSRIIVFGRNEGRAEAVMQDMRKVGMEGMEVRFVKGDLSTIAGQKTSAKSVEEAVGKHGIDYLIMCQNGPPTGMVTENADGEGFEFMVQAVSRFTLAYLLTTSGALRDGATVMTVANPGLDLPDLEVEDLSLKKRSAVKWKVGLFFDQSKRDSVVLDSVMEEMSTRYPKYRYLHLHPGLVKSEMFETNSNFPWPMSWLAALGLVTFASTPQAYANVPVYIAVNPSAASELGGGRNFDQNMKPVTMGSWAQNSANRELLWAKLKSWIGQHWEDSLIYSIWQSPKWAWVGGGRNHIPGFTAKIALDFDTSTVHIDF